MANSKSNEMDTIAWAVSTRLGAEALALADQDKRPEEGRIRHLLPFFLLVGLAIENGLKAALEYTKLDDSSPKWTNSHDLSRLMRHCRDRGFILAPEVAQFVDDISMHHKEHHFRYPQKADEANLPSAETVLVLLETLLSDAFNFIRGPVELLGIKRPAWNEQPPQPR
jgi:hypothetical protein